MGDAQVRRLVVAHFVTMIGEWAAVVGVLVFAYDSGGASAVGIVSLAVLSPPMLIAPLAASATARWSAQLVRMTGFAIQAIAYTAAAVAAGFDAELPFVAALIVVGVSAVNTMRPTGAVMLPAMVRSTEQLTKANLAVSYCDSSSALLGPLLVALVAGIGGPAAAFAASASAAIIAVVLTAWRPAKLGLPDSPTTSANEQDVMRAAIRELRARPWSIGVMSVSGARNLAIGAFDVLMVILALDTLGLGDGGSGLLTALVGLGAVLSTVVITIVVRRSRLTPTLLATLVISGAGCIAIGVSPVAALIYLVLPLLGLCLSSMDNLSRILMQRSTNPRQLGAMFACLGFVSGAGQLTGALFAQVIVAVSGPDAALIGLGLVLVVLAGINWRALRDADRHADVPVVEMSLLATLPMFAPLPAGDLENVARAARAITVADGVAVIEQGATGETFYAVSAGQFDVAVSGNLVRTAHRGDWFGEVALLADVPRTATVTSRGSGELLEISRGPFLLAVTGHDVANAVANEYVRAMQFDSDLVAEGLRTDPHES